MPAQTSLLINSVEPLNDDCLLDTNFIENVTNEDEGECESATDDSKLLNDSNPCDRFVLLLML